MSGVHEPIGGPVLARILGWSSEVRSSTLHLSHDRSSAVAEVMGVTSCCTLSFFAG